jgi:hypothetical protein
VSAAARRRYLDSVELDLVELHERALEANRNAGFPDAAERAAAEVARARAEHDKYEATIARYIAAGRTRAYARRMLRLATAGIKHPGQFLLHCTQKVHS